MGTAAAAKVERTTTQNAALLSQTYID